MDPITLAIILAIIGAGSSAATAYMTNRASSSMQEDAQEWSSNQALVDRSQEYQYHLLSQLQDPTYQYAGLKATGMSDAAALQAITGSHQSWSPSIQTSSPVFPQSANFNQNSGLLQGLFDAIKSQNDIRNTESGIEVNQSIIDMNNAKMVEIAKRLDIDQKYLELAEKLNESQIGLNSSQAELNFKEIEKISKEIERLGVEINNIAADTNLKSYQIKEILSRIDLNKALESQAYENIQLMLSEVGVNNQEFENLIKEGKLKDLQIGYQDYLRRLSNVTGWPIDSDDTSKIVLSMMRGDYDQVLRLINCIDYNQSGPYGAISRSTFRSGSGLPDSDGFYSIPRWNP